MSPASFSAGHSSGGGERRHAPARTSLSDAAVFPLSERSIITEGVTMTGARRSKLDGARRSQSARPALPANARRVSLLDDTRARGRAAAGRRAGAGAADV